jgi:hypothetical protein
MESTQLIPDGSESRQFKWKHLPFIDRRRIDMISPTYVHRASIKQATAIP